MKYDELLAKIDKSVADIPVDYGQFDLVKALRAVVELHKPFMYEGRFGKYERCSGCASQEEFLGNLYPCPTIQAIEKELNGGN